MNTHILYKKGQRSRTTTEDGGGATQPLPRVVGPPWCATLSTALVGMIDGWLMGG